MAISVKNHEDRIVALENKIVSSAYVQTTLWSGSNSTSGATINLSQSFKNFDQLILQGWIAGGNGTERQHIILNVKDITIGYRYSHTYQTRGTFEIKSETSFYFLDQGDVGIAKIVGIKFSNVILYYVSNIIYTKFKLRLNSAIAIFNRLFLHKFITGGETWKWL